MNRNVGILVFSLVFLVGCASIKEAISDFRLGKETPLAADESSPADEAQSIADIAGALPVVGPFAGTIATVLTGMFTWRRGRRLRKGMPTNSKPITGAFGGKIGLEGLVQTLSDLSKGVFEVGGDNSSLKRGWKVFLAAALGLGATAAAVPSVGTLLAAHPEAAVAVTGLAGLFGGLEKALSKVEPVVTPK